MSEPVWTGECGTAVKYMTSIREHEDGLIIEQAPSDYGDDDIVLLGPEALEAIKEWLKDTD